MTYKRFEEVVNNEIKYCNELLLKKCQEYTPEEAEADDRLRHFKKAAILMGIPPKAALLGMLSKHLVSVADMCMDSARHPIDKWTEKVTDSINYLYLLLALVIEEDENEKH